MFHFVDIFNQLQAVMKCFVDHNSSIQIFKRQVVFDDAVAELYIPESDVKADARKVIKLLQNKKV